MADPQSSNIGLNLPTRGSDVGVWDTSVNGNNNALDGLVGGALSLTLTAAATTTLTLPAGFTPTPSAGPVQSQNAIIKLSGTLTGNNTIVCTRPGPFVVYNNCVVGGFSVVMSNGSGNQVGLPPGALWHVFNDGTNYYHCNLPQVGELSHLCVATTPGWITASSLPPYIGCDGSTYNISAFPNLGASLGSTFGGNGLTTFGVPDLRGTMPLAIDYTGARVTIAGSGINGQALGTSGGSQLMAAHTHAYADPSHSHAAAAKASATTVAGLDSAPNVVSYQAGNSGVNALRAGGGAVALQNLPTQTALVGITISTTGSGGFQNMPPVQVTGIWLIRAA